MSDETKARAFNAALQADIRRERRLLYAEIVILLVLLALAYLRIWWGP